jgi:hypothetical protein
MLPLFKPLDEYERIARNQPHPGIDKSYPKVTDGTTAAIIQKTPKRIIQQIPTGKVQAQGDEFTGIVAEFIFTNRIIPNANHQFALIQKWWTIISRGLTYGCCPYYTPFLNRADYFGTDLAVPFIKDVFLEPGKLSDADSNFIFMRSWYQPRDIEAIIDKEKSLKTKAKERQKKNKDEPAYESGWNLTALRDIKDQVSSNVNRATEGKTNNDKKSVKEGVEIIHAFQRGKGAKFFSFHAPTGKIVRTKVNKDPRGQIPIGFFYADVDLSNPLGRGYVENVSSLQNLIDSEMQMYQYNRALMLNPPMVKRGNWSKTQAKFAPNVIIDLGSDPNSSFDSLKIDSTAITAFPNNYGLMKSQLLNVLSSPDSSISSEVGNPGFSKTPAGVNMQAANVSVDDNYIRKQFEHSFENWAETAINLYFAERTGVEELQLDKATANKIRQIDESLVSEDDKIRVDYEDTSEKLKFEVDASTSNMKDNNTRLEALDGLLARLDKSPALQGLVAPDKVAATWNSIVAASGTENPEDLTIDLDEMKAKQEEAEMMAEQQAMQQGAQPGMPPQEQAPAAGASGEDDAAFVAQLQELGISDERIQQALAMEQSGMPEEQILEMLAEEA